MLELPQSLRSARLRVGLRAARGLLVVAVLAVGVLGARWWWVDQRATAVPVLAAEDLRADGVTSGEGLSAATTHTPQGRSDPDSNSLATATGSGAAAPGSGAGGRPTAASVLVHVVGKVHEPGVVELPPAARVVDAVDAAGGVTQDADLSSLNLARTVQDGEQVWVGAPGEKPPESVLAAPGGSAAAAKKPDRLDLNSATAAELETVPGIGPVTAGKIIGWRERTGGFTTVTELLEVSGIGELTLAEIEPWVQVSG